MSVSPVFIVGSPRSGTSILIGSLLRAGYNGFLEGNFISLARVVERDVDRFFKSFYTPNPRVLMSKIDRTDLKHRLSTLIVETALAQQPSPPWVDKTGNPEMIETIPFLREMFPNARFIFAKRRAIENIVSRLIKFPGLSFDYHCADWARTMAVWRNLRDAQPATDLLEVDQREISLRPEDAAKRVGSFLEMTPLETATVLRSFTSQTPQETQVGTAHRVLTLQSTGWTGAQISSFHKFCNDEMQAEGYSNDETYWAVQKIATTSIQAG